MGKPRKTKGLVASIAASMAISGCATPYVVNLPKAQPAQSSRSIEKALDYLDKTREVFRDAVTGQISDERSASNAFIGAGALVAALALGKVNRDGVIGATALAGTGYALASNNLPRTRLQIHQEVVKALNCAERAALPLAISDSERDALSKAVEALRAGRQKLFSALEDARAARANVPDADIFIASFKAADPVASAMLDETAQSVKAGGAFLDAGARAATRLVSTVTDIRDSAIGALGNASTPLAAVPLLVQGLAKDYGSFAPGAGIEALVADSLKKSAPSGPAMSSLRSTSKLGLALTELEAAERETLALQAAVNSTLRGRNTSFAEDAFKDCNVAQVITALAVSPTPLKFSGQTGGQRVLEFKGGSSPTSCNWTVTRRPG